MEKIKSLAMNFKRKDHLGDMCRWKGNTGSLFYLTNLVCHFLSVRLSWNVDILSDRPHARCNNCNRCHGYIPD